MKARRLVAVCLLAAVCLASVSSPLAAAPGSGLPPTPPSAASQAPPGSGSDDVRARELFLAHRYTEALRIYARLRTDTGHPTYLRNLGRCHQMLGQPDAAISHFQMYLREARDLSAAERTEVEGYIAEMKRLRAAGATASPVATPSVTLPAAVGSSVPRAASPTVSATSAPTLFVTTADAEDRAQPPSRRWMLWTGIGGAAVAAAVVAGLIIWGGGSERLACPPAAICGPGS